MFFLSTSDPRWRSFDFSFPGRGPTRFVKRTNRKIFYNLRQVTSASRVLVAYDWIHIGLSATPSHRAILKGIL